MCELAPNNIPLGLIKNNLPVAVSVPKILEASTPTILFKATDDADGW